MAGMFGLNPIGRVESALTDRDAAPKQGNEGAPDAWIAFESSVADGLADLAPGDRGIVLTWLHQARGDVLEVHPRDDPGNPLRGVFSPRSAERPNPIGLHPVDVLAVGPDRIQVRGLEAVDGTPVVDLKTVIGGGRPRGPGAPAVSRGRVATRLPAQDLERARRFYSEKLGLEPTEERPGGLLYRMDGGGEFGLFQSGGAPSGEHTQMGWQVDDIEATVAELRARGLEFEQFDMPGVEVVDGIA